MNELSERQKVDEKRGVIRVTDYKQTMVISEGDGQSSRSELAFVCVRIDWRCCGNYIMN